MTFKKKELLSSNDKKVCSGKSQTNWRAQKKGSGNRFKTFLKRLIPKRIKNKYDRFNQMDNWKVGILITGSLLLLFYFIRVMFAPVVTATDTTVSNLINDWNAKINAVAAVTILLFYQRVLNIAWDIYQRKGQGRVSQGGQ